MKPTQPPNEPASRRPQRAPVQDPAGQPVGVLLQWTLSADLQRRRAAEAELLRRGDAAVPALADMVKLRGRGETAADVLGRIGTPAARAALLAGLAGPPDPDDPKDHRRLAICLVLRELEPPVAPADLLAAVRREAKAGPVAKHLLQTLARLDSPEAAAACGGVLRDDAKFARADLVRSLEPLWRRPRHAGAVLSGLAAALRTALSQSAPPGARPTRDEFPIGRVIAMLVVANAYHAAGGKPDATSGATPASTDATPPAGQGARPGAHPLAEAADVLAGLLDRPEPDVRTLAAHTLGLLGPACPIDLLRKAWHRAAEAATRAGADETPDPWPTAELVLALARNGDGEALAALQRLAAPAPTGDADVRAWARAALAELSPALPASRESTSATATAGTRSDPQSGDPASPATPALAVGLSADLQARAWLMAELRRRHGAAAVDALTAVRQVHRRSGPWPGRDGDTEVRLFALEGPPPAAAAPSADGRGGIGLAGGRVIVLQHADADEHARGAVPEGDVSEARLQPALETLPPEADAVPPESAVAIAAAAALVREGGITAHTPGEIPAEVAHAAGARAAVLGAGGAVPVGAACVADEEWFVVLRTVGHLLVVGPGAAGRLALPADVEADIGHLARRAWMAAVGQRWLALTGAPGQRSVANVTASAAESAAAAARKGDRKIAGR